MQHYALRRGLDLPIAGSPNQTIHKGPTVTKVGLLGADYIGLKPRLAVAEGDPVGPGTAIFSHKETPQAHVVSPVSGQIRAIHRGPRRTLISVEIDTSAKGASAVDFSGIGDISTPDGVAERLCAAGLWTSFRTRPYSKVPDPQSRPSAIFVTAMDTEPLCPDPQVIIEDAPEAFAAGLRAIALLGKGSTYVCHAPGMDIPAGDEIDGIECVTFSGPHPAGLPGTHIHFLTSPAPGQVVWTIWYQDVIAIGRLMQSGKYDGERVIALSGPLCKTPRLVRTVAGASMEELTEGEIDTSVPERLISGSALSGRSGDGASAFLGRYARQITAIEEDQKQIPMGWIRPMASKFAFQPVLGSALSRKIYAMTSNLNGGRRAMVPVGTFEELMPQDFLPTQLLRSILVMDTDAAQNLGVMELDEEDLGIVGFACPAKYEYGIALRDCLTKIEKEG